MDFAINPISDIKFPTLSIGFPHSRQAIKLFSQKMFFVAVEVTSSLPPLAGHLLLQEKDLVL
jgi:hypothetical protein